MDEARSPRGMDPTPLILQQMRAALCAQLSRLAEPYPRRGLLRAARASCILMTFDVGADVVRSNIFRLSCARQPSGEPANKELRKIARPDVMNCFYSQLSS